MDEISLKPLRDKTIPAEKPKIRYIGRLRRMGSKKSHILYYSATVYFASVCSSRCRIEPPRFGPWSACFCRQLWVRGLIWRIQSPAQHLIGIFVRWSARGKGIDDPIHKARRINLRWRAVTVRHSFHVLPGESILEIGAGGGIWSR